jgi:hypothetical protein
MRTSLHRWTALLALVALAAGLIVGVPTSSAATVPCSDFLQPLADWAKQPDSANHVVKFVLVSNSPTNLATYSEGSLDYRPASSLIPFAYLSGSGFSYRNDQRYYNDDIDFGVSLPFDASKRTATDLAINLSTGQIRLNGGAATFTAMCENGVLYGFTWSGLQLRPTMWVLSLTQAQELAPPN